MKLMCESRNSNPVLTFDVLSTKEVSCPQMKVLIGEGKHN